MQWDDLHPISPTSLSDMTSIWLRPMGEMLAMESERVFVDTSAFYALMDRSDRCHAEAN